MLNKELSRKFAREKDDDDTIQTFKGLDLSSVY